MKEERDGLTLYVILRERESRCLNLLALLVCWLLAWLLAMADRSGKYALCFLLAYFLWNKYSGCLVACLCPAFCW